MSAAVIVRLRYSAVPESDLRELQSDLLLHRVGVVRWVGLD